MFSEIFPELGKKESKKEHDKRFADGRITEEEIKTHWEDPSDPLFEHELTRGESGLCFRLRALTKDFREPLLGEIKSAWQNTDYESLRTTLDRFFEQKSLNHPGLLNVEYYIATDTNDKPFAITGIYTIDIMGGAGFATRNKLDPARHYLSAGLGWFSVSKGYQGAGVGGFLLDWTEKMAKSRGAKFMFIETADSGDEENARKLYEKRGYKQGFGVKNYFGPGRDKNTNYLYLGHLGKEKTETQPVKEEIDNGNKEEILKWAKTIYSPDRFKEFEVCLNLFLQQKKGENSIIPPESMIIRDEDGGVESFSIFRAGPLYANAIVSFWHGIDVSKPDSQMRFKQTIIGALKDREREVFIITGESESGADLSELGLESAEGGIPYTYEEGDETRFLLYTKKLE